MQLRANDDLTVVVSAMTAESAAPWYWKPVGLFDNVDEAARHAFFKLADKKEFAKSRHLFFANDPGNSVFYLSRGLVKIYNLSENGEATIHWFCVPSEVFGMGGISGSADQMVFAQAVENSLVFMIPRHKFEDLLHAYPRLGLNVIKLMGARLRLACDAVADLSSQTADRRLARQLMRLAENCGQIKHGAIELRAHITHQEFANMIGSCRQTVTVALQDFRDRGLIDMKGRCIIILKADKLEQIAGNVGNALPDALASRASSAANVRRHEMPPILVRRYWKVR
jgi:CRP-like cAMP-binding protein